MLDVESKNDHGNETYSSIRTQLDTASTNTNTNTNTGYVDHTLKPELKLKILTDPTPEGLAQQYNTFPNPIKFSQYQLAPSLYTIAVYYEEK